MRRNRRTNLFDATGAREGAFNAIRRRRPVGAFNAIRHRRPVGAYNAIRRRRPVGAFNAIGHPRPADAFNAIGHPRPRGRVQCDWPPEPGEPAKFRLLLSGKSGRGGSSWDCRRANTSLSGYICSKWGSQPDINNQWVTGQGMQNLARPQVCPLPAQGSAR